MNSIDRDLGMDRPIDRREFVNGVGGGAGRLAAARSGAGRSRSTRRRPRPSSRRTTTRRAAPACAAATPARSRSAHQLRDGRRVDLAGAAHTGETYDLVVVGGGLSGLAAAYYFVEQRRPVRARAGARQPRRLRRPRQAQRVRRRRQAAGAERRHAQHRVAAALQPAVAAAARRDRRRPRPLRQDQRGQPRPLLRRSACAAATSSTRRRGAQDKLAVRPAAAGPAAAAASRPSTSTLMPISAQAKADMLRLQDPQQPDYMPGLDLGREEGAAGDDEPRALPARGRQGRQAVPVVLHGHRPRRSSASAPTRFRRCSAGRWACRASPG